MSGEAIGWARRQVVSGGVNAKAVLILLADYCGRDHECYPSVATMGAELQVSERSVQRALRSLEADLLVTAEERLTSQGATRSRLYRLHVGAVQPRPATPGEGDTQSPTRVTHSHREGDTQSPGGVTHSHPHYVEPSTSEPVSSDELTPGERARDLDEDQFAAALAAYPKTGRTRTDLPEAKRAWRDAAAAVDPARLVAAVRRYAVEDRDLKRGDHGAKGFHAWLRGERWRVWLPATPPDDGATTANIVRFDGPKALRVAVADRLGDSWACSYLDPCGWRDADRTLLPRTAFARDKLAREASEILKRSGVALGAVQCARAS